MIKTYFNNTIISPTKSPISKTVQRLLEIRIYDQSTNQPLTLLPLPLICLAPRQLCTPYRRPVIRCGHSWCGHTVFVCVSITRTSVIFMLAVFVNGTLDLTPASFFYFIVYYNITASTKKTYHTMNVCPRFVRFRGINSRHIIANLQTYVHAVCRLLHQLLHRQHCTVTVFESRVSYRHRCEPKPRWRPNSLVFSSLSCFIFKRLPDRKFVSFEFHR